LEKPEIGSEINLLKTQILIFGTLVAKQQPLPQVSTIGRKNRMTKMLCSLTVLAAAAFAPLAHADINITYSVDGSTATSCGPASATFLACTGVITLDGVTIQGLDASDNAPGTASLSKDTSATADITNAGSTTATIVINIMADGFTSPVTPPAITLDSHIGGTVVVGVSANTLSYQSCVGGNNLLGCPGTFQSGIGTPAITSAGSYQNDQVGSIASLAATYSIDETLTIVLGANGDVNFSASTTLSQVPEPSSVVLLGSLLIGVGLVARRKLARNAA